MNKNQSKKVSHDHTLGKEAYMGQTTAQRKIKELEKQVTQLNLKNRGISTLKNVKEVTK